MWEELWEAAVAIWEKSKWLTVMVRRHSTNGFSWTETYERHEQKKTHPMLTEHKERMYFNAKVS